MPKRNKQPKRRPTDVNQLAHYLGDLSTQDRSLRPKVTKEAISLVMAELGRRGGKIGGKRRLETMTKDEREEAASHAARVRWAKRREEKRES